MKSKEEILRKLGISTQVKTDTWNLINLAMEEYASQVESEILDALVLLHEEAPRETRDADWWEDSFKRAMEEAEKVIDKYLPEVKSKP